MQIYTFISVVIVVMKVRVMWHSYWYLRSEGVEYSAMYILLLFIISHIGLLC